MFLFQTKTLQHDPCGSGNLYAEMMKILKDPNVSMGKKLIAAEQGQYGILQIAADKVKLDATNFDPSATLKITSMGTSGKWNCTLYCVKDEEVVALLASINSTLSDVCKYLNVKVQLKSMEYDVDPAAAGSGIMKIEFQLVKMPEKTGF